MSAWPLPFKLRHRGRMIESSNTHLGNTQVLLPCDSRQVSLVGEDFPHAQLGKYIFQIIAAGDGKLWQVEVVYPPRKGET